MSGCDFQGRELCQWRNCCAATSPVTPPTRSFSAANNVSSQICFAQHYLKTCTSTSGHNNGSLSPYHRIDPEESGKIEPETLKKTQICQYWQFLYRHKYTCFLNTFLHSHFPVFTKYFSSRLFKWDKTLDV